MNRYSNGRQSKSSSAGSTKESVIARMNESIELEVDMSDLDRNGLIPVSKFYTWAQMCRHKSFYNGLLREFLDLTGGSLMVKAQAFMFDQPNGGRIGISNKIHIEQKVASIGKTSFTLGVDFYLIQAGVRQAKSFAHGYTTAVSVIDGKTCEIPQSIGDLMQAGLKADSGVAVLRTISSVHARVEGFAPIAHIKVVPRSSDEDANYHVNQARFPAFFEDAIVAAQGPDRHRPADALVLDYVKQAMRGIKYDIVVKQVDDHTMAIQMLHQGEIITQGLAKWKISTGTTPSSL